MTKAKQSVRLTRLSGVLGFFIGIFGAMAILGVFFKILKLPHYETFMIIGFVGEACAFVIMGIFSLIGAWSPEEEQPLAMTTTDSTGRALPPNVIVRATFQKMLEKQVSDELNQMMAALSKHVGQLGGEIEQVGSELERTRHAISLMSRELDRVASGDLAGDAERLGRGMNMLGSEMNEAGHSVERIRTDLDEMAKRFRHFNEPHAHERVEDKIKKMPWT